MENCEKKKKFFLVSQSYAFELFIIAREHLRARRQQLFTRAETPKHACTVDTRIFLFFNTMLLHRVLLQDLYARPQMPL